MPKIRGTHTAMKSGMVAAEAIAGRSPAIGRMRSRLSGELKESWVWPELHAVRNVRPGFAKFGF